MNKSYRTIWNESLGAWVAASELATARGKRSRSSKIQTAAGLLLIGAVQLAQGNTIAFSGAQACGNSGGVGPDGTRSYAAGSLPVDGSGTYTTVAGCSANGANLLGVTLFGAYAAATGDGAVALGMGASAGKWATSLGLQTTASGVSSVAIGFNATAAGTGSGSIAVGNAAVATGGSNSIAIGTNAFANGGGAGNSMAVGNLATATGNNASALGNGAVASNVNASALGTQAVASGSASVAAGTKATASGANSVAIGNTSTAAAASAVVLGDTNVVAATAGTGSTAIGFGPWETLIRTFSPTTSFVPARGAWPVTVPVSFDEFTRWMSAFSPIDASAATASVACFPITPGTATFGGPVETKILTVKPLFKRAPGSWSCE